MLNFDRKATLRPTYDSFSEFLSKSDTQSYKLYTERSASEASSISFSITSTHRFRIVFMLFSLVTVFKSYRIQSFLFRCKVKTQRKVAVSMKTI